MTLSDVVDFAICSSSVAPAETNHKPQTGGLFDYGVSQVVIMAFIHLVCQQTDQEPMNHTSFVSLSVQVNENSVAWLVLPG